jgi:HPt (histidine-containing phosphotransfer) domain-containing protein
VSGIPEALRARFVERCRADLETLEGRPDQGVLHRLAHGLSGAGGTFGHPEISGAAGRIDDVLADGGEPEPGDLDALADALRAVIRSAG